MSVAKENGMARSERLFEIIGLLRDGEVHRAQDIAARLGVSVRTVYRDMESLAASGVPLKGDRGTGYRVTPEIALPPLHLGAAELEALNLGIAIVAQSSDPELAAAAEGLGAKIDAVLPAEGMAQAQHWDAALSGLADPGRTLVHLPLLRAAVRARQKVRLALRGEDAARVIRPLHVAYWGRIWTVIGWCEGSADFAELRLDLIESAEALPALFVEEDGKRLADFRR
jgi:predicted DNA-binding transcriptional regulator YafY